ncbi:MAG TPA: hypothetical protein VFG99_06660, partial [Chloroflexia bacterium]|nr:hypothetical protein [Chloroflexia bacterium]
MSKPMWGIMWRMVGHGSVLGALFGGVFGIFITLGGVTSSPSAFVAWTGTAFLLGALAGGGAGFVLGLVIGLTLFIITLRKPRLPEDLILYRRGFYIASLAYIGLGLVVIGVGLRLRPQDIGTYLMGACIPTMMAIGGSLWAGNRVASWVT